MRAAVLGLAAGAAALSEDYVRANVDVMFADFQSNYGRTYATEAERARRQGIFTTNMLDAAQLEKENPMATFGVNRFSDMSSDEFRVYHSGFVPVARAANSTAPVLAPRASDVDWRKKGAVTAVKDQARCGSCWAFSAIGAIEGGWFVAGNPLLSLSEQELVSCGPGNGCGGGDMYSAVGWVKSHGGVNSEKAYPYTSAGGSTGSCSSSKSKTSVASVKSYGKAGSSESAILTSLNKYGPLSIGVDAGKFQSYRGGIMSSCSGRSLDHGVQIVGYSSSSSKYWVVKNSWGKSWGESGYIRLQYGSNQCGMTSEVTYSTSARVGPPPAPPVPPGAARFHCDKGLGECLVQADGHATVGTCLTACGAVKDPRYHCDKASKRCIVAADGHATVATCLAACQD